jgi:hypothetical protein
MDIILETLQDNAIISNVISIVVLGVLGIIANWIKNSISSINTEKTELLRAKTSYERIDMLATLVEKSTVIYKDAVLGSNLPAPTKAKVLEDYTAFQEEYKKFLLNRIEKAEPTPVAKPIISEKQQEQVVNTLVSAGQDLLSKLSAEITASKE